MNDRMLESGVCVAAHFRPDPRGGMENCGQNVLYGRQIYFQQNKHE